MILFQFGSVLQITFHRAYQILKRTFKNKTANYLSDFILKVLETHTFLIILYFVRVLIFIPHRSVCTFYRGIGAALDAVRVLDSSIVSSSGLSAILDESISTS